MANNVITIYAEETVVREDTAKAYRGVFWGLTTAAIPKAKVASARKLLINCYVMLRDEIGYEEFVRQGEVGLCEGSGELGGNAAVSGGLMARPAIFE